MKILVIGSDGFIGSNLIKSLLNSRYEVSGIDIVEKYISEYIYQKISVFSLDFNVFIESNQFDFIINCSGSGNVNYSIENPFYDYELNTIAVFKILDAIRKYQNTCRYIQISSAAVYGNPLKLPISEEHLLMPISPYGHHKWQSELICKEFSDLYQIPVLVLRPFSVYGPGLKKQLLWDVFQKAKNSNLIELWGTGEETRDFIYVDDLCDIILKLLKYQLSNFEIFNIAMGESVSISQISEMLICKLGYNTKIKFNNLIKLGNPRFWKSNVNKLSSYGIRTSISLEDGINETAKWLLKNG